MTSNTTTSIQQELAAMSDEQLWVDLSFALRGESKWVEISAVECLGLLMQERISRHAQTCQNLDCEFNPFAHPMHHP